MKIGLLSSKNISEFCLKMLNPIFVDFSFSIKVVVIDSRPAITLKQKLIKHLKRGRGGYIIIMALESISLKNKLSNNTKKYCIENGIDVIETENPYSTDTINKIKKYNLDVLILIGGYGIVKKPLLSLTPIGILSYHHGDMRKYRGGPPAFWELYNNEKEMGVTVQILSSDLDRGIPVDEKVIEIRKNDTWKKLQSRAYQESIGMMYSALKKLLNKKFYPTKIDSYGKVYTLPNLRQWIILNIKILWRKLY
jgi:folate-dependent phosphoribosylglycinamide formyltransferase PurN